MHLLDKYDSSDLNGVKKVALEHSEAQQERSLGSEHAYLVGVWLRIGSVWNASSAMKAIMARPLRIKKEEKT